MTTDEQRRKRRDAENRRRAAKGLPPLGQWGGKRKAGVQVNTTVKMTVAAEPVSRETRRPMFSDEMVAAILQRWDERRAAADARTRTPEWNPFRIAPEKFGPVAAHIKKHHPKLAMDQDPGITLSNNVAIEAWQAGGLLGNAASEGLLFMGYPFLAMLAQRPEFRLFGEIRAQEMTRKWIEFHGTQDESTGERDDEDEEDERDNGQERPGFAGDQEPEPGERNGNGSERNNEPGSRNPEQAANEESEPRSDKRNQEIEDKIKELTECMDDFRIRDWFQAVAAQDAFFGISHLMIDLKGTDAENLNDPELRTPIGDGRDEISETKLTKGCVKGFRTIEPIWVYPTTYNAVNPLLKSWYEPQVWYVMGTEVHRSRLLTFIGRPVPDILKPAYAFGGLAMTQMAQPYVDIWLRTRESVGQIIHAFSVMVLSTNLGTTTMPGGSGGGQGDVLARVALFNMLRDNQGAFVIDKATEDFKNVSAPISGLHELQAQAQEHMFSVGRIPAVKFAGIQPTGLNASSEGEMRAFYDTVLGEQQHLFRPHLTTIIDLLQIHLWGKRDPDITFDFVPLWELTEKEKAEKRKLDAECDQIRIDSGVVSQEEVRRKVAADPDTGFHHLDPEDVPDLLGEEMAGLIVPEGGRAEEGILGGGAGPGGPPGLKQAGGQGQSVTPFGGRPRAGDQALDEWTESEHPRDPDGKFAESGSSGGGSELEVSAKGAAQPRTFATKKDHAEHLLKRGVTTKEMLSALGWPSISMPAMAKSLNMRLERIKEGKVTKYIGHSLGPRERPEKTHSLLPFLAKRGGLRMDDGNISDVRAAIGKSNKFIPGFGQLIRPYRQVSSAGKLGGKYAAMDLDTAREAAAEAGYIDETTTLAEFIDAIDRELRGERVYPAGYLPPGRSEDPDELAHQQDGFMRELHDYVELSDAENKRAIELWTHEGIDAPLDVLERIAIETDDREVSTGAPKRSAPIPGWDDDRDAIPF